MENKEDTIMIAVIGGGAAGFMAAVSAVESSDGRAKVSVFETGIPLKSILVTGNGRCNLSNSCYEMKELCSNYPRGEKFLYSAFSRFGVEATIQWFSRHGIETYVQTDKRIFPKSDKAAEIRSMFLKQAKELSIDVFPRYEVSKILKNQRKFTVFGKNSSDNFYGEFDKVIVATGGNHRRDFAGGYNIAKDFGHRVSALRPSLTAFVFNNQPHESIRGVSLRNALISAFWENKKVAQSYGDFIFTREGISGPCVFKLSSQTCFLDYSHSAQLRLKINFVPQFSFKEIDRELIKDFDINHGKSLDNILKKYIPKSLASYLLTGLLKNSGISNSLKISEINKEQRKSIAKILSEAEFTVVSPRQEGEIVTAGGICLDEINPKTMESKLVNGLYFCGEILDIDGGTGGFNLQACWSCGYIAGDNAARF